MTETRELLMRWHSGDEIALAELIRQHQPWITSHVQRRLGGWLRARVETQDIVQNTLLAVLQGTPRFVCDDRDQLRALLARLVENTIRAAADHATAARRDVRREANGSGPGTGSVLMLDCQPGPATEPPVAAARAETRDWLRLALELLDAQDRDTIYWREYAGESFAVIAARLGVAEDAARMRFTRALPKLAAKLRALRAGRLGDALPPDAS